MGAGHDRQRVLDHQDDDVRVRADARRPRRARLRRAGVAVLAGVRGRGQGRRAGPQPDGPHAPACPGGSEPMQPEDLADWEKCTSLLAAQAPWWEPGTAAGYHAVTQGYLIGEVVRRITGDSIGTFFAREVAEPLGADFFIGTPASADARVAPLIPPDAAAPEKQIGMLGELGREDAEPTRPVAGETQRRGVVAPGGDPGRRRTRQRALGGDGPVGDRVRRRGPRQAAAVRGRRAGAVRRAGERGRPGARRPASLRARLRARERDAADGPEHVRVGRLRRLASYSTTSTPGPPSRT